MVGPGCNSCYKESFQYSSLPRTCACTHRTRPCTQPSCKYMSACIGMCYARTEACIWVCTHAYAQRHAPTYPHNVYSIHVCADLHTRTSYRPTQTHTGLHPRPPKCTLRVHRPGEDHPLRKLPRALCAHRPVLTVDASLAGLLTKPAWRSQPRGCKQATTTRG